MQPPALVSDPDKVTPEWLTEVLTHSGAIRDAHVVSFDAADIGTGQVGCNIRYRLTYDPADAGPPTVVAKFASRDEVSRQAGIQTRTYETEVAFYRDLADSVDIRRPHCHFAQLVPGTAEVALVFEDLAPSEQGDQIAGCSAEQAALAMAEAAKLHGPRWGDVTLRDLGWLSERSGVGASAGFFAMLWKGFVERYRDMLTADAIGIGERIAAGGLSGYGAGSVAPPTVVHNDFRLDNMLFGSDSGGAPLAVVDWQTVSMGVGTADVSYFLGTGMSIELRRAHEKELVRLYHERLVGDYDVNGYGFDDCWLDYRRFAFGGFLMAVLASMLVGRTDRGDAMFMAMANGSASQVLDLESESLLG